MSPRPGTVFKCGECGKSGHTCTGCPWILERLYPVGSMVGEFSTVIAVEIRSIRLKCRCGAEYSRSRGEIQRRERERCRITCGKTACRCARRLEARCEHA